MFISLRLIFFISVSEFVEAMRDLIPEVPKGVLNYLLKQILFYSISLNCSTEEIIVH